MTFDPLATPTTPAPTTPAPTVDPAAPPTDTPIPSPVPAAPPASLTPGTLVNYSYFDPYSDQGAGGAEISVYGIVVDVVATPSVDYDTQPGSGARVAWFTAVSDPVPVDELTRLA